MTMRFLNKNPHQRFGQALFNLNINSERDEAENNIKEIQDEFVEIYKLEEMANLVWLRGDLSLDSILMYHLRAIEDGSKFENFGSPQSNEGENGSCKCEFYIKILIEN